MIIEGNENEELEEDALSTFNWENQQQIQEHLMTFLLFGAITQEKSHHVPMAMGNKCSKRHLQNIKQFANFPSIIPGFVAFTVTERQRLQTRENNSVLGHLFGEIANQETRMTFLLFALLNFTHKAINIISLGEVFLFLHPQSPLKVWPRGPYLPL